MAKVLTFSRTFPKYHPKAGQPTYFVEKFWESIGLPDKEYCFNLPDEYQNFLRADSKLIWPKHHTIRAGHRFKKGDYFSPRVWSGKPYNSPQITIAPDTIITDVWDFSLYFDADRDIDCCEIIINNIFYCEIGSVTGEKIAKNDGLEIKDFIDWFTLSKEFKKTGVFKGQIICYNENIKY